MRETDPSPSGWCGPGNARRSPGRRTRRPARSREQPCLPPPEHGVATASGGTRGPRDGLLERKGASWSPGPGLFSASEGQSHALRARGGPALAVRAPAGALRLASALPGLPGRSRGSQTHLSRTSVQAPGRGCALRRSLAPRPHPRGRARPGPRRARGARGRAGRSCPAGAGTGDSPARSPCRRGRQPGRALSSGAPRVSPGRVPTTGPRGRGGRRGRPRLALAPRAWAPPSLLPPAAPWPRGVQPGLGWRRTPPRPLSRACWVPSVSPGRAGARERESRSSASRGGRAPPPSQGSRRVLDR